MIKNRDDAARKIQHLWKRYRLFSMIPKALKARKNMAASLIQRYVKGYIGWRGINRIIREKRLKANFEYFSVLREKLVEDS